MVQFGSLFPVPCSPDKSGQALFPVPGSAVPGYRFVVLCSRFFVGRPKLQTTSCPDSSGNQKQKKMAMDGKPHRGDMLITMGETHRTGC